MSIFIEKWDKKFYTIECIQHFRIIKIIFNYIDFIWIWIKCRRKNMLVFLYTEYSLHIPLSQLFTFYKNLYFFGGGVFAYAMMRKGGFMRKIDIHSHILPGFDDGAADERESIRMLKMAARQGIESVIATPHYSAEHVNYRPQDIRRACASLEQRARKEISPDFHIYPGQEILYTQEIFEHLECGKIQTMADSSYTLIEFMPWIPYSELYRCVRTLVMRGYQPILAHIERYEVLREKCRIEELTEMGALMQMNYRRIDGKWYEETTRWCRKMLREGKIHFLATDMHNTKTRKPMTDGAEVWLKKHLEKQYIAEICYKNARKIIKQQR